VAGIPHSGKSDGDKRPTAVLPKIGGVRLSEVNRDVLRTLYRSLPASTARNVHTVLSSAFSYAVEEGLLAFNPCATVKAPAYKRAEAAHLDVSEARRMLECTRGDHLQAAVILGWSEVFGSPRFARSAGPTSTTPASRSAAPGGARRSPASAEVHCL
jgi:hypothetical protein